MIARLRHLARLAPAVVPAALLLAVSAHATTINFDSFASGTPITTQYQAQGVVFAGSSGPAHIYLDPAEATSSPNILVGDDNFGNLFITFVDTGTGLPTPVSAACGAWLTVISAGHAVVHVRSRDGGGNVVQDFEVTHPEGPENGFQNHDPLAFTIFPIQSIEMIFTLSNPNDGMGIDDLSFESCVLPATPSTWGGLKGTYR
jgi:hypothetical protein